MKTEDNNVYEDIERDLLKQRILFMESDFDEDSINVLKRELMYCMTHEPTKPVTLYISSNGGDCYDWLTLYGFLQKRQFPLITIASGKCMSAGAYLLLLGDERLALDGARIMLHELAYEIGYSKLNEHRLEFEDSKELQELLNTIVKNKTKIKNVAEFLEKDRFFSKEEAFKLGILTSLD